MILKYKHKYIHKYIYIKYIYIYKHKYIHLDKNEFSFGRRSRKKKYIN